MTKITTLEIEVRMMQHLDFRTNLIVPNVSWGIPIDWNASGNRKYGNLHECDLLSLSVAGYATEVEIKVSKADLIKDDAKKHSHDHNLIKYLYFAVPKKLEAIALEVIPERAGLFVIERMTHNSYLKVKCVKRAKQRKDVLKWSDHQRYVLARLGAMRIVGLKQKLIK
jgi:hypothetical protein